MQNQQKNVIDCKRGGKAKNATLYLVRVALMCALLSALKFALSYVPNVEVVTLLIMVFGAVFGAKYAVPATLVFCSIEVAMYGVQSWVLLYFIFYPLLALTSALIFGKKKLRKWWIAAVFAVVATAVFDVLSACTETLVLSFSVDKELLGQYWVAYYVKGVYFYIVHCASNAVIVGAGFVPLAKVGERVKNGNTREIAPIDSDTQKDMLVGEDAEEIASIEEKEATAENCEKNEKERALNENDCRTDLKEQETESIDCEKKENNCENKTLDSENNCEKTEFVTKFDEGKEDLTEKH